MSSCTIGGGAASLVTDGTNTAAVIGSNATSSELWIAEVPTGTSGTVSVTWSGGQNRCGIGNFRLTGLSGVQASQVATDDSLSGGDLSASLTISSDGGGLGGVFTTGGTSSYSWTNLTEAFDGVVEAGATYSGALSLSSGTATRTVAASPTPENGALVLAAWDGIVTLDFQYTGQGGVRVGGSAPTKVNRCYSGQGGLSVSGAAVVNRGYAYAGQGGMEFSGSGSVKVQKKQIGSGGVSLSVGATLRVGKKYTGTGGLTLAGAATVYRAYTYTGDGRIRFRGYAWVGRSQAPDSWSRQSGQPDIWTEQGEAPEDPWS